MMKFALVLKACRRQVVASYFSSKPNSEDEFVSREGFKDLPIKSFADSTELASLISEYIDPVKVAMVFKQYGRFYELDHLLLSFKILAKYPALAKEAVAGESSPGSSEFGCLL
jgi:hypothetical protein